MQDVSHNKVYKLQWSYMLIHEPGHLSEEKGDYMYNVVLLTLFTAKGEFN